MTTLGGYDADNFAVIMTTLSENDPRKILVQSERGRLRIGSFCRERVAP